MPRNLRWMAVVMGVAALALSGCTRTSQSATDDSTAPFELEVINEETGLNRIIVAERAAQRIGIKTEKVGRLGSDPERTTIPYGSLLYLPDGTTYVYTSPEPLVYVRQSVTVDSIENGVVVVSDGPAEGTSVVTDGAAELTGIEFGVGK